MFGLACEITGVITLAEVLKRRREELQLSQEELGLRAGVSQSTIGNLESGARGAKGRVPSSLPAVAVALGTTTEALLAEAGMARKAPARSVAVGSPDERGLFDDPADASYASRRPRVQVPVIGRTMGGVPDRIWDDEGRPTGVTDEYADLATDGPHAFLVRVEGDSMSPKYDPGGFALVEPDVEPGLGEEVLVRLSTGETMLKRLLSRRGGMVQLASFNNNVVLTFRVEEIVWMYYVAHPVPARRIKLRL